MMEFMMNEDGQGMVEYGLILALIAIVAIGAVTGLGGKVKDIFGGASNAMTTAAAG